MGWNVAKSKNPNWSFPVELMRNTIKKNSYSIKISLKHTIFYLLSYLNSKYGRSLLLRKERGAIQKGLNLDDLKSLDIPLFSDSLYKSAELCIKKSLDKIDFAEHHYETECTVRWNESLSETAIKNASITSVVDSQEKELAAAI